MEKDDLIKKLEEVSLPEIEISSHKRKLRTALLAKYFPEKKKAAVFDIFQKLAPVGVIALILLVFAANSFLFPQSSLAKAREIALRDPQIKEMMAKGADIKNIEIVGKKAYVLVGPAKAVPEKAMVPSLAAGKAGAKEEILGVLAEINFQEKRVAKINKITPQNFSLSQEDKEKTTEMARENLQKQEVVPQSAEVLEVKVIPSAVRLIRKDNNVQIVPVLPPEATVIYENEKQQWEGKINLQTGEMKNVQFLGEPIQGNKP